MGRRNIGRSLGEKEVKTRGSVGGRNTGDAFR